VRAEENYSADDGDTILITKKRPPTQPPPTAQPVPTPEAKEPPKPKAAPSTSGMNIITLEEMVEADTTMIPNPGSKENPPAGPKQ
jgi:hypothetical protein